MNLEEQLLADNSKENAVAIAHWAILKNENLQALIACFFSEEYRINQRATFALMQVENLAPNLLISYLELFENKLLDTELTTAQRRNIIRILQTKAKYYKRELELYDYCLKMAISKQQPVAVRAFAMRVATNIVKKYPELKHELVSVLNDINENQTLSNGLMNRLGKCLKALAPINKFN